MFSNAESEKSKWAEELTKSGLEKWKKSLKNKKLDLLKMQN